MPDPTSLPKTRTDGQRRAPGAPSQRFHGWLVLLVLVNLFARLPLCWDPANVDNDGAEYLAIARHLRTTGQYATDLKWQFFTDDPVRHPAWADRPPLYPFFAVLCQRALPFLDPTSAARVGNLLLAGGALVLVALYLRRLYGERVALLATGYVFLLPHMLYWTTQPMTETLTLALTYGALLLWPGTRGDLPRRHGDTERHGDPGDKEARKARSAWGAGLLTGLAYLARPTGAILLPALLLDSWRSRRREYSPSATAPTPTPAPDSAPTPGPPDPRTPRYSDTPTPSQWRRTIIALLAGFAALAVPFHFWLWRLYGSPTHSALGFTFAVRTYYEVSYYGFEAPHPTAGAFLAHHALELPVLVLHQVWRHLQALVPPLAGLLPLAFWMRPSDWRGNRWAAGAFVALHLAAHTVTWAAWGSSRYFLVCLPILIASLLAVGEHGPSSKAPDGAAHAVPPPRLHRACVAASAIGLAVAVGLFYRTQLRPDHGLASLPEWRLAAKTIRGVGSVAADKPGVLNLLLEVPAVRLPRTTDRAQLARFIAAYRPEALVLFADEPAKQTQAQAWRNGGLPAGWQLAVDRPRLLIALPLHAAHHASSAPPSLRAPRGP